MRYSTDPRKQRKQQRYITIFVCIFVAIFVISQILCYFYNLFCA